MLFNSFEFIIFFIVVVGVYFIIPQRYKWVFLLAASFYFYMSWEPKYIILILIFIFINFYAALFMEKTRKENVRRLLLCISLIASFGILFSFKYFNFFNTLVYDVLSYFNIYYTPLKLNVLLPVGISFYTFQTISYTIDVYNKKSTTEKNIGIFALYVTFFPQLVAGPIERSDKLIPQLREKVSFDYDRVVNGLRIMLWGFFKKVVIADRIAPIVNNVYNSPERFTGIAFVIATVLFAFQIFCDFSGYSDIAIGIAKILGFDLMKNFKRPYFARNIAEFWNRWHISLSTWFRDYLYIPLGGNRRGTYRMYINLLIVFVVSGLWHGASLTFVIWGLLHGIYIVGYNILKKVFLYRRGVKSVQDSTNIEGENGARTIRALSVPLRVLGIIVTFMLVVFAWIFFRANTLSDALFVISSIREGILTGNIFMLSTQTLSEMGLNTYYVIIIVGSILLMELVHLIQELNHKREDWSTSILNRLPLSLRWGAYYLLILAILLFGEYQTQEFIYFQF